MLNNYEIKNKLEQLNLCISNINNNILPVYDEIHETLTTRINYLENNPYDDTELKDEISNLRQELYQLTNIEDLTEQLQNIQDILKGIDQFVMIDKLNETLESYAKLDDDLQNITADNLTSNTLNTNIIITGNLASDNITNNNEIVTSNLISDNINNAEKITTNNIVNNDTITTSELTSDNITNNNKITTNTLTTNSITNAGDIATKTITNSGNIATNYLTTNYNITTNTINGYNIPSYVGGGASTSITLPSLATIKSDGVMEVGKYIDFHVDSSKDSDVRMQCTKADEISFGNNTNVKMGSVDLMGNTHSWTIYTSAMKGLLLPALQFRLNENNTTYTFYLSPFGDVQINTTITHNAPIEENIDDFIIGAPVFTTGKIYNYDSSTMEYVLGSNSPTDCISSVKPEGTYREYLGICVGKHSPGETVTIGDVMKHDVIINQYTIDFATHGDFHFRVTDSSYYDIGDIVLYDGTKLGTGPMTIEMFQSIVGKVTGIIDKNTLAVFKT